MTLTANDHMSSQLLSGTLQDHKRIMLRGTPIDAIDEAQCTRLILSSLEERRGGWVITANLDHLRRQELEPVYRTMMSEADLVVADGMPLIWASRLQRTPLPERIAGSTLVLTLTNAAMREGRSVFLLGGNPGTAKIASHELSRLYPDIEIAGIHCPPFGFEDDVDLMGDIIDTLVRSRPDIVYVALGSPKQERLIREIRHHLPEAWWLGVGISFSFLAGEAKRAPKWVQVIGMEWVHRLAQEPRRLAKRYLVHGIPYAIKLLLASALCGLWRGGCVVSLPSRMERADEATAGVNVARG